jgi:L-rhamnose mutarotase
MTKARQFYMRVLLATVAVLTAGCQQKVKRVGMVIGLKPERMEEYRALHADSHAGVRDIIEEANMRNFSIYLHRFDDGKYYMFGYYEYVGDDFEADMAKLNAHPRIKKWLAVTDSCQVPLKNRKEGQWWATMERVYFNQ